MGCLLTAEAAVLCGSVGPLARAGAPWVKWVKESPVMSAAGSYTPTVILSLGMAMLSTLQLSKPGPLNETIVGGPLGLMVPAEILPASLRAGGLALTSLIDDVTARGALHSMPYLYS